MKFSFVVPVYNMAPWLRECFDSLLAQDWPRCDYEIVAVNDGSTDNSLEILREYEAALPAGFFVIIDQQNAGLGPSRNTGLAAARGEYIWFVDSDDIVRENTLRQIAGAFGTSGTEILLMEYGFFTDTPAARDDSFEVAPSSPTEALCFYDASVWSKIFSREFLVFSKMEYPPLARLEDMAETFRLLACADKILKTGTLCYHYRQRPGSMLRTYGEHGMRDTIRAMRAIESQIPLFPGLRDEYEYVLWKSLRWVVGETGKAALFSDADSRAAVAAHMPVLRAMLAAAANPANPYIRIVDEQTRLRHAETASYKNSFSWKITAPLRFLCGLFEKYFGCRHK